MQYLAIKALNMSGVSRVSRIDRGENISAVQRGVLYILGTKYDPVLLSTKMGLGVKNKVGLLVKKIE